MFYHLAADSVARIEGLLEDGHRVGYVSGDAAAVEKLGTRIECVADRFHGWHALDPDSIRKLAERIFGALAAESPTYEWLLGVFGSSRLDYFFARTLYLNLTRLAQLGRIYESVGPEELERVVPVGWPDSLGWRVSLPMLRNWRADGLVRAAIPGAPALLDAVDLREPDAASGRRALRSALYVVQHCWYVLKRTRLRIARRTPAPLLIRTYKTDIGLNLDGRQRLRNVTFVVENQSEISRDAVAVWVESGVSPQRRKVLAEAGYRLLDVRGLRYSLASTAGAALPLIASFMLTLVRSLRSNESAWWRVQASRLVRTLLVWEGVCRQERPRAFLYYNDESPEATARNIVLKRNGCRAIAFQHSCNTDIGPDGKWSYHSSLLMQTFDVLAVWGASHRRIYADHSGQVDEFWDVGCLWSEHAALARRHPELREAFESALLGGSPLAVPPSYGARVGVFDSSVSSMHTTDHLAWFYLGVCRVAARLPQVQFVCKPKNPLGQLISRGGALWQETQAALEMTTNVAVVDHSFETAAVIGLTDLSISICFTSTAVEAAGCGKRAVYYDPSRPKPHAFWYRIPGMVCVSDEELYERVRHLLWECDDEAYMDYLQAHYRGIEEYLDGQAITRLRRRLAAVMDGRRDR